MYVWVSRNRVVLITACRISPVNAVFEKYNHAFVHYFPHEFEKGVKEHHFQNRRDHVMNKFECIDFIINNFQTMIENKRRILAALKVDIHDKCI